MARGGERIDLARDEEWRAEAGVLRVDVGTERDQPLHHLVALRVHVARQVQRRLVLRADLSIGGVIGGRRLSIPHRRMRGARKIKKGW